MVPMPDIDSGGPRELVPKPSLEKETEMYKPTYPNGHYYVVDARYMALLGIVWTEYFSKSTHNNKTLKG